VKKLILFIFTATLVTFFNEKDLVLLLRPDCEAKVSENFILAGRYQPWEGNILRWRVGGGGAEYLPYLSPISYCAETKRVGSPPPGSAEFLLNF
jgi:hypothetical protein